MEYLRIWYMDTILTSLILLYELKNTKPMPYLSLLKLEFLDRSGYESRISSCIWYRPDRRVSPYLFISSIRLNWWLCTVPFTTPDTLNPRHIKPRHVKPQTCQTPDISNPRHIKPKTHRNSDNEYRAANYTTDKYTFS